MTSRWGLPPLPPTIASTIYEVYFELFSPVPSPHYSLLYLFAEKVIKTTKGKKLAWCEFSQSRTNALKLLKNGPMVLKVISWCVWFFLLCRFCNKVSHREEKISIKIPPPPNLLAVSKCFCSTTCKFTTLYAVVYWLCFLFILSL